MSQVHRYNEECCRADSKRRIEYAIDTMQRKAMRITSPRLTILQILLKSPHPLSAEQIYKRDVSKKLDLVTVYRNLAVMDDVGVVQRHQLERGKSLYALVSHGHHHHHVICRRCGIAERLPSCDSQKLESAACSKGFVDLTHVMEVYGVCPTCTSKSHD